MGESCQGNGSKRSNNYAFNETQNVKIQCFENIFRTKYKFKYIFIEIFGLRTQWSHVTCHLPPVTKNEKNEENEKNIHIG